MPASLCHSRAKRPAFPCRPIGSSIERAVAGVVVADRRHRALGDRQLQMQAARRRDDLAERLPAGKHRGCRQRLRRHRLRAPRAERGQKQGQEQDRRKKSGKQKARGVPLGPPAARAQPFDLPAVSRSGSARRHRMAGGGRSHGRHHSRPCRKLAFLSATISTMSQRPTIRIPRWIQLVGLPVLLLIGVDAGGHAGSRDLPLPDRVRDRVPAQPARAVAPGAPDSPRLRGCRGLPLVRGCDDRGHRRARHGRRRADALGGRPGRRLPYGRARTQRRQRLRP